MREVPSLARRLVSVREEMAEKMKAFWFFSVRESGLRVRGSCATPGLACAGLARNMEKL